jgi:hypothetical protein
MKERGYGEQTVAHYTGSLKTHAPFLKRISFLFQDQGLHRGVAPHASHSA